MQIKTISTSISLHTYDYRGQEAWLRKDIVGELKENEDPLQAYQQLENILLEAHSQSLKVTDIQLQKKETIGTDEDIYALMDKCTTPEELAKGFYLICQRNKNTFNYYEQKLKSLIEKQLSNG